MSSTPSSPRHRKNSVTSRTRTSHSLEPRHNGAHGHMGSTSVTTPSFSVSNVSAEGTGIAGSGQDSQIKFAITSQSLNNQKASMDEQYMSGKATTFNSAAVYNPMPTVGGRSSELANTFFAVEVKLLSDDQPPVYLEVSAASFGQWLFDKVIECIGGVLERDYFGLRYLDKNKQRQWLDLSKTVYKQLKHVIPRSLNFRVKHYPARPLEELKQEKSRYFLYLQLRRDLHSGRLIGRTNDMHVLAAHILQAEIGDIDKLEDYLGKNGSLADLKMFENMTPRVEAKIRDIYKTLRGTSTADAEAQFLERSSELETYGVEPVFVQDRKGNHFYVGLSHEGVTTFRGNRKAHVFMWSKIHRISFDGKLFIIQVEWEQRRHTLGFKCQTSEASEALWKWAVDRQCFFTLNRSTDAKRSKASGRLFRRRQLYTFTGRCQKEMLQMTSSMPNIPQPSVKRSRSLLNIARNVGLSRQTRSHEELHRAHNLPNCNTSHPLNHSSVQNLHIETDNSLRLVGVASESADFSEIPVRLHEEPIIKNLTNQVEPQFPAVSCSSPSPSPPNLSPTITETAEVNGNDRKSVLSSAGQSPPVPERFQEEAPFQSTEDVKVQQEPTERSPVNEDEPSEAMTHAQVMRLVKQQKMQSFDEGSIRDPPMQSQSCPQYTSSRSTDRESRVSASSAEAEQSRRTDTRKVAQVPTSSISSRSPSPSSSLSSHTSQPSVVHLRPEAVEAGTSQQIPVSVTVHPGAVLPSEPINYDVVDTGPSSSSNSSSSSPKTSPEPSPRARPALTPILRPRAVDRGSTNTAPLTTKSLQPFRAHDQENTTNSSSQWNPYAPIAFADDSDSSAATRTKGQNALVSEQTPTTSSNLYFPYLSRVSIITDSRSTLAPLFVSTDSSYPRAPEAPRASGPLLSFSPSSYSTAPEEALPFALASSSHNETAFTSSGEPSVVYTNPITYMPLLTKPLLAAGSDKAHLPETTLHRATLLDKLEKPSPAYRLTSITPVSSVTQSSSSSNISCLLPYQSFIYSRAEGNAGLGGADIGNSRCTQVASSLSQTTNTISAVRENDRLSGSLPSRGPLFSFITGASGVNDSQEEYKRSPMPPPPPPPLTSARIDNSLLLRHGYTPYRALENHPPDLSTSLPEGTLSRFYSSVALSQQRKLPTGVAAVHEKKVFADEPEIMPEELFPLDVDSEDTRPASTCNASDVPAFNWKVFTTRTSQQEPTPPTTGLSSFREKPASKDRTSTDYPGRLSKPTEYAKSTHGLSPVKPTTVTSPKVQSSASLGPVWEEISTEPPPMIAHLATTVMVAEYHDSPPASTLILTQRDPESRSKPNRQESQELLNISHRSRPVIYEKRPRCEATGHPVRKPSTARAVPTGGLNSTPWPAESSVASLTPDAISSPSCSSAIPSKASSSSACSFVLDQSAVTVLRQLFLYFGVFICVHFILRALRVGPILGFFGATGPDAVGYWNALEAIEGLLLDYFRS